MIEIGSFQFDLDMRVLRRNGEVVNIGSRAFDILAVLASAGGRLVTKDELIDAVWPDTVVEENNVQVHLSALRKILGPDRDLVLTVPGRGYQLLQRRKTATVEAPDPRALGASSLPPSKAGLQGREGAVQQIRAMLVQTHVLTLVGAGGIGKTSLAIEAARQISVDFNESVSFVELASLTADEAVLCAIAEASCLDLAEPPTEVTHLAAAFGRQSKLLVLDNAEHVIGAVAQIADALVAGNNCLRVLVTSREPLRIAAETVFRVDPLDVPSPHSTTAEILRCSAVKLFLQRANTLQGTVGADSEELRLVGEICRRLDGIPLAIELAAARVVTLGVEGVHRLLDDRMAVLAGGYRTALPRHQTLRATFDWSFGMLTPDTQSLFRRLALFGRSFTFEAMCAVACDEVHSVASAIGGITELVAKSLVDVEFNGPVAKYRLSESTRAYALEKLVAEGELQSITSRNASYLSHCFEAQTGAVRYSDSGHAQEDLQQTLDDARVACDWAFSRDGDLRIGIELASNLASALLNAGMIEECCARAAQAVDTIDTLPAAAVETASEMRVRTALACALPYVRGPVSRAAQLWRDVLALARASSDQTFHTQALWGLWNTEITLGNINESIRLANQFQELATQHGTPWQKIVADQMVAISQHCRGEHTEARHALASAGRRLLRLQGEARHTGRLAVDPMVFNNGTLARIAWLKGEPDEATALVDTLVDTIRPETIEPSLTHVLGAGAIPLALLCGDLPRSSRYIDIMRSQAAQHGFAIWLGYCECMAAYRDILAGRAKAALPVLEAGLDALMARGFRRLLTLFIVVCAEGQIEQGRVAQAKARLDEALDFCQRNGELVFLPEVWRALGLVAQAEAGKHARTSKDYQTKIAAASACFSDALGLAQRQGAKMWELRAAMAMARLLDSQDRVADAIGVLAPITADLESAARTPDVKQANALLGTLHERRGKSGARRKAASSGNGATPPSYSNTAE